MLVIPFCCQDLQFFTYQCQVQFEFSQFYNIALADGQQVKTHGLEHVVVCLGTNEIQMHVIVAEVEDEDILGMDFPSQADSHTDVVKSVV